MIEFVAGGLVSAFTDDAGGRSRDHGVGGIWFTMEPAATMGWLPMVTPGITVAPA